MLLQERIVDEFAFILIGAIILLFGLTYFIVITIQPSQNISKNATDYVEVFSIPYLKIDTINRSIVIVETQGFIYKSLFSEKQDVLPLKINLDELSNVEKIKVYFESEENLSEVYLISGKTFYPIYKEIPKEILSENNNLLIKIAKLDYTIYTILAVIYIVTLIALYLIYRKYSVYAFEIKIIVLSISIIFFSIILIFGSKKVTDRYFLKVEAVLKSFITKTYSFYFFNERRNVTIYFELERATQTAPIKIIINNDTIYFGKPYTTKNSISKEISLKKLNYLTIEVEGEAIYELKNIKVLVGPARS